MRRGIGRGPFVKIPKRRTDPPKQEIAATAAPWRYELCPAEVNARVIGAGGQLVAVVWSGKRPSLATVEANAQKIAAAPDILTALEAMEDLAEVFPEDAEWNTEAIYNYPWDVVISGMQRALRKARGGA